MKNFYLSQNTIPKDHIDKLANWLTTYQRLTQGELVKQFENKWSEHFSVNHSIFCNSGSSANLLAFSVLKHMFKNTKLKIAICSAGWSTTLSPLIQLEMDYTFIDIDKNTFGMDMNHLEECIIKEKINAVVVVHTLGVPVNIDRLLELKNKYNLFVIEDTCPAVGSKYNDKYLGTLFDMGTFSFYYGHQISTIEGGMISTNNSDIKDLLYMMRNHGWSNDLTNEKKTQLEFENNIPEYMSKFTFYVPGYNLRGTELNAFLGLLQLDILDSVAMARNNNFNSYRQLLSDKFIVQNPNDKSNVISCITFPAICSSDDQRKKIYSELTQNGIETRPISGGNLSLQPYNTSIKIQSKISLDLHYRGFVLPCHPGITYDDIKYISDIVKCC